MKARRILIIVSMVFAVLGLILWMTLPALVYINTFNGKVTSSISGVATIFGGDVVFKHAGGLSSKIFKASPMLIIAFILIIAGIALSIVRLVGKKNMVLMIIATSCFALSAIFVILTKQLIVPVSGNKSVVKNYTLMGPIFVCVLLFISTITSSLTALIKRK